MQWAVVVVELVVVELVVVGPVVVVGFVVVVGLVVGLAEEQAQLVVVVQLLALPQRVVVG